MIFIYANVASVISIFVLCTLLSITGKKMLGGINEYLETRSNAVICKQRNIFQGYYTRSTTVRLNARQGFFHNWYDVKIGRASYQLSQTGTT